MKIVTIVGARPQFVKAAVVGRALRAEGMEEVLVHTGQHFDANMSDVFFAEMELPQPHWSLGIANLPHGALTGRMLEAIENVLLRERPDIVLVLGDTDSTLAGALAAVKLHIPVAHVEAGLRSFNRRMPEEINRVLTDHVSEILFAPTSIAAENLLREGVAPDAIHVVGDVMYDAALHYARVAAERSKVLHSLGLSGGGFVLATIHRAENTDDRTRLADICAGLEHIAKCMPVVMPLHPRTRGAMQREELWQWPPEGMLLIEPVGYLDMVMLEQNAAAVVTDSGGVQKEAFFYRVPCITVREETEWVELVDLGWNRLAPPAQFATPETLLEWAVALRSRQLDCASPYGEGDAGVRIAALLRDVLA